jgi:hypothetical protein
MENEKTEKITDTNKSNMKTKYIGRASMLLIAFAFLLAFAGINFAAIDPKLQLMNYSISEIPAQPGHVVNLTLVFKSIEWDICAEETSIQLSVAYPLSVEGLNTHYLGNLCQQDSDNKSTTSFILPIDSLAQTGVYQVIVASTYQQRFQKYTDSNTINVLVGGVPSFVASVAASQPVDIYPGDLAYITIAFQNNGSARAENARVTFDSSIGINVKWAGQTQELGQIQPRGSATATVTIDTAKDLDPGIYKLYATISYASENATVKSDKFTFNIPILKKAEFNVSSDETKVLASGDNTIVNLTLTNSGQDEAKEIKAMVKPVYPFSTDGTVRYIESLKPGESAVLTYTIHVDKDAAIGKQLLSLSMDFKDSTGKQLSDTADFSLLVKQKTLVDSLTELWYLGALIVLLAIISIVRRKTKKQI